jgi:hypothetical protein
MKIFAFLAGLGLLLPATAGHASPQEPVDWETIQRIRSEGFERSQVMDTLWYLTDRYGPRLTNSPQERRASRWTKERLESYGLANVAIEPWGEFGVGWSFERSVVEMTAPIYMPLIAVPKAWTRGLEAPVEGTPVWLQAEKPEDLEAYRGKLGGKIVLVGKVNAVETPFESLGRRQDVEDLEDIVEWEDLDDPSPEAPTRAQRNAEFRRTRELRDKMNELLLSEGAACVLEPDGGRRKDYGVIMLGSGGPYEKDKPRALPQLVVSTEQFNRIARLIEKGEAVEMRVDVKTTFYDDDLQGYDIVAEIPGTDPEIGSELVMLGGHFDSWHPATGTTDNGIGSAVGIEAIRILKALELAPRRTIRLALWTGEEQGLLGSKGYVKNHFADPETMELLPEHGRLAAYFNLDNGGGRIRGIYLQENLACKPIFEAWFAPLADLGASTITPKTTGGTDHLAFDAVGLPGFQFIQDPIDYSTRSHHTNMDLYERVIPNDAKQASVVMATFVWQAAQRDAKLPRKPLPEARKREEPPAQPPAPAPTPPATAAAVPTGS